MASTTFVDNSSIIYASWLNDVNSAVYNGTFISSTITPTNIVCNGSVSGTGFSGLVNNTLTAPGAIGNGTPNTGAFTTLSTSGLATLSSLTVSGASNLGTPTTLVGTNITGTANSLNAGIGVNQTWTDVKASRVSGTSYPNNTGKPIQVIVSSTATTSGNGNTNTSTVVVGGVTISVVQTAESSGFYGLPMVHSFIVPNGQSYSITNTAGSGNTITVQSWVELK